MHRPPFYQDTDYNDFDEQYDSYDDYYIERQDEISDMDVRAPYNPAFSNDAPHNTTHSIVAPHNPSGLERTTTQNTDNTGTSNVAPHSLTGSERPTTQNTAPSNTAKKERSKRSNSAGADAGRTKNRERDSPMPKKQRSRSDSSSPIDEPKSPSPPSISTPKKNQKRGRTIYTSDDASPERAKSKRSAPKKKIPKKPSKKPRSKRRIVESIGNLDAEEESLPQRTTRNRARQNQNDDNLDVEEEELPQSRSKRRAESIDNLDPGEETLGQRNTRNQAHQNQNEDKNPHGYSAGEIDEMLENNQLILVVPNPKTTQYTSPAWAAGLRMICFPDGRPLTNWYRCFWCGMTWNCQLKQGTSNMSQHLMRHFNATPNITLEQLAEAFEWVSEYTMKYGKILKNEWKKFMPIKNRGARRLNWQVTSQISHEYDKKW